MSDLEKVLKINLKKMNEEAGLGIAFGAMGYK
jgi:hypothetical protein